MFLGNLTGQLENGMVKNAEGVSFVKPLKRERSEALWGLTVLRNLYFEDVPQLPIKASLSP